MLISGILFLQGCADHNFSKKDFEKQKQLFLAQYGPQELTLLGLSKIQPATGEQPAKFKFFVAVLDQYNTPLRYPGVIRFELYTRLLKSPISKGRQICVWPEIDIRDSEVNSRYFRDYLRAYEFELEAKQPVAPDTYVVLITYTLPDGRRIVNESHLTLTK
jgi:hypothetical protein